MLLLAVVLFQQALCTACAGPHSSPDACQLPGIHLSLGTGSISRRVPVTVSGTTCSVPRWAQGTFHTIIL